MIDIFIYIFLLVLVLIITKVCIKELIFVNLNNNDYIMDGSLKKRDLSLKEIF